jgi:hypothetical protein
MRLLKLGIISLIVFGLIVFVFSLFIPSHVRISRAMTIGKSKADISAYIADMRTWSGWNEMITSQDSNGRFEKQLYTSPKLKVEIVRVMEDSITTSWKYQRSDPINSGFYLVQSLSDTTVAQWYFDFHLDWYPWEKFGSIIFDQQLGPPMEKSLLNLKNTLENQPR